MDGLDPNYGTVYLIRRELRIDEAEHKRIRAKVEADVADYIEAGGEVEVCPTAERPRYYALPVKFKEELYDG